MNFPQPKAAAGVSKDTRMPLQDKTAEKMLNNLVEFLAATLAKPDQRAWDQLLIYCPREAIERRKDTRMSTAKEMVTDEMVTAAMRAFELMSSVLRYREKDKWHSCDIMGMRDAIAAALRTLPSSGQCVAREALEEIRKYCDENHGPLRSGLVDKITAVVDRALAVPQAAVAEEPIVRSVRRDDTFDNYGTDPIR